MPPILTVRLELLCNQNKESFALKLVAFCRKWLADSRFLEACSPAQQEFWLDLHVTLLYHQEASRAEILPLLEQYSLEDGSKLVKRLVDRKTSTNGTGHIWRNCLKTAEFVTTCLLTTAFVQCTRPTYLSLLAVQLVRILGLQELPKASKAKEVFLKMVNENKPSKSSHMYTLCETFLDQVSSFPFNF